MKKRILSILLCCVMLVGLLPTAAFAEGSAEEPPVCSCETACTAEAMNTECPVCGAVGALPESCAKCSGPVEDAAAEPEVEDNEAQPEASPVVLSGKREIKSEAELNVALGDKSCTEITLGENIELSGGYIISHTVTLDLNGYTLTVNGDEWDIFSVYESGNLTVKDSGTGGKIDGQNKNCGFCIYGGVLTLESGTIINCMTDGDGSAVDISSGDSEGVYGKFVMNGGAITNCKATDDGGAVDIGKGCTFIMNSGTISGCRADDDAGAIFIKGNASFLMNGGTIENCSAGNYGGAVKIRNTSRFTMNGGTISSCTAQQGGGVYVDGSSTFTMNDGSIASCTAVNGGNSVFVVKPSASFTMTGGTVDGSIALPYKVGNNTVYMDGLGTAAYPYQISTADQLKLFRDIVNGAGGQTQNRGAYAVLTADIDLNNEPWTPIGPDRDSAYTGTFDGQGHTVRNLSVTVNVQPGRAGLFGCVKDGTIRKLTVAGSVSCTANQGWCGGIAGYAMDETIENCASLCTVSCTGIDARVGGIVGLVDYNSRTLIIRDCYNIGKITGRSDNGSGDAGGICGFYMNGKISNCYNVGEITGSGYVSKIAVSAYNDSRPTNCYYLSDTDTDLNGTAKTAAEFANGDVLEELKAGRNDSPWDSCQYVAAAKITLPVFKGQGDEHTHNGNWTPNGNGTHSRRCTCNVVETQNCSGGTATCTQRATCTVCGAEYGDVLGHDFTTSWTHDDNEHWKQCSRCDEKDDVGPHTWNSGTVTTAPTCTKAGEKTYSCNKCDATKIEPIPATGHSWKSDWTSDATHHWHECTNKNCDVTDNAGKNGYAEHSGGKATCTQNAVCEFCKAEYGEKLPHDFTAETVDAKYLKSAATCTEKAVYYKSCAVCGLSSEGTADEATFFSGNALDHNWGAWTQNSDEKTHTRICKRDTSHTETENCHGGTATCTAKAVCTVCGGEYGEMAAHSFTAEKAETQYLKSAATCTEKAIYYKSCAVCGLSSEGTADEATFFSGNVLDHDWGAWTQNSDEKTHTRICKRDTSHTETENCHGGTATCTAKAVCTVCGGEYGEMAAHSFTAEKAETQYLKSAATCTEKAIYYKSCAVCGLSSEGTADEATFFSGNVLDHDWGAWTQNSDEKTHTRICKRDTSHTETENCHGGTATCTAKAVCTVCGGEYGEMAAHSFTAEKAETQYLKSAATCTEKAIYYKSCAVCGLSSEGMADEATFFSGNALDHDWGAWTSNEDGTHTRTCTVDGCSAGTQTENCIDANKDHKCDICDYIISECADDNKDHKCDYCGKKLTEHTGGKATCKDKAKCEVCGAEYGEFDANNHSDLKHIDAKAATKDAEGNIEYWYCEGCGKYFSDKDGTKEIKKADTVTAKLKDDSKLPQTGDTSNLALWIALLFISGGAAIGTTIVSRKKKYSK